MSLASIIALGLDDPRLTAQELATQALAADQEARRLARAGRPEAADAKRAADEFADACARRAREEFA